MAYQLQLPANLKVHNVFHVSSIKRHMHDPTHIIDWKMVQLEPEPEFQEEPLRILVRKEKILRSRAIAHVKVQWKHFSPEEPTWEFQEDMLKSYPILFWKMNEHSGQCLIQVDIGGHPPIPLGPPPLLLSVFQFPHSLLFLAVFWVLNFRSRFEALNDIFLGKQGATWILDRRCSPKSCIPRIDLSNEV
jgi:hypothetical protein